MEQVLHRVDLPGVRIATSREPTLMGTAGGLALARSRGLLGQDGPVLVVNGDCLVSLELAPLLERAAAAGDLVTLGLMPHPDPERWSRVVLDGAGTVAAMLPPGSATPGETPFLYPGVMVVSRTALDALPVEALATPEALWEPARVAGRLGGAVLRGRWREVGTPAAYLEAALDQLGGRPAVDPTASVDRRAELRSSYVAEGARVAAEAVVDESVVACGAMVGRGARVTRSVLLGPIEVGEGETVADRFLAAPLPDQDAGRSCGIAPRPRPRLSDERSGHVTAKPAKLDPIPPAPASVMRPFRRSSNGAWPEAEGEAVMPHAGASRRPLWHQGPLCRPERAVRLAAALEPALSERRDQRRESKGLVPVPPYIPTLRHLLHPSRQTSELTRAVPPYTRSTRIRA